MATNHLFGYDNEDVLLMSPRQDGADFDDEGTGSSGGYGDMDEDDDFLDEDDEDDDIHDEELDEDDIEDDVDDDSTIY